MAKTLTPEQRAQILALFDEGLSRNEIARRTGISAGSVTNVCNENDRAFDRSATKDAQAARSVDLAEARLNLAQRLNVAANDMLDMLDKPFQVYNFGGKDNTFAEATLESPPVEARRTIITSTAIVFDKLTRIVEKDNGGLEQAVGVLDQIADGFKAAAEKYRSEAPDESE